jgi:sugar phosphate isomerase/epimerase
MGRHRYFPGAGSIAGATASSYLAWLLAAFVLLEWPRIFLAAVSDIELGAVELSSGRWFMPRGILPHAVTHFPEDGSATLYAFYHSGFILWGIALLAVGVAVSRRAAGWWRVFSVHVVVWAAVSLVLFSGVFLSRWNNPLMASMRALRVDGSEYTLRWVAGLVLGTLLLGALVGSIRHLLDGTAEDRAGRLVGLVRWLVFPVGLASVLISHPFWQFRSSFVAAFILGPVVLALIAGVPAALTRGRGVAPLRLERRGGLTLLVVSGVLFATSIVTEHLLPTDRKTEGETQWSHTLAEETGTAEPRRENGVQDFFHRGISFSHEVGGRWGYGSDRALEQLQRIRDLGANAVAIVPYAFTRAPRETRIDTRTDETDERVVRTLMAAQRLGLRVTLKPSLWGPGFTGDIAFEDEADFEHWFEQYRGWMLKYARLAQRHRVDLLVIGTELGGVSDREAAWRGLIADVRRIYSGPLTYAANWDREFEAVPFWDALDYLGLNMYYPLAAPGETPRAGSARVQELVETIAALARQHGKKILFTEVGYPSTASAAAEPWKEDWAPLDVELQRQCYETVFEGFAEQPWLAGLYWWKWPSHGRGSAHDGNYSPLGKPALEVIARWYGEENEH